MPTYCNSTIRACAYYRVFLCLYILLCLGLGTPANALQAGAAKIEITPPLGTPLDGLHERYGRGATSIHSPLWARALYLNDGDTAVVLVNTDLYAITEPLRARILELATEQLPGNFAPENIVLTATHTHNAPGGMQENLLRRQTSGRYLPELVDVTAKSIVQAIRDAVDQSQRATIGYATAEQSTLSVNRFDQAGPIDPQIGVLRVDDADGKALAIVANFAALPDSVVAENPYTFSADYVHYFYEELEALSTEGCIALFFTGAAADQSIAQPNNEIARTRTESVGRLLAARVKQVANDIVGREARFRFSHSTPPLPGTLVPQMTARTAALTALEIDDLLLTFFPGLPDVDAALTLRSRALALGYDAHYTIALAQMDLGTFLPKRQYAASNAQTHRSYYGPHINRWLSNEFEKLMSNGRPAPNAEGDGLLDNEPDDRSPFVVNGNPFNRGYQRGRLYAHEIRERYESMSMLRGTSDNQTFSNPLWKIWGTLVDTDATERFETALADRATLTSVSESITLELDGIAHGAGIPFDALWMLQSTTQETSTSHQPYHGTTLAVVGDRAGADDLLIAFNAGEINQLPPLVLEVHPDQGHALILVTTRTSVGAIAGMNDAGLVLCGARLPGIAVAATNHPNPTVIIRQILETTTLFDDALEKLQSQSGLEGYTLLLGATEDSVPRTAALDFTNTLEIRNAADGILLGIDPTDTDTNTIATTRYTRVADLLAQERIVGIREMQDILTDHAPDAAGFERIQNDATSVSVVFEPKRNKVHIAFPMPGASASFTTYTIPPRVSLPPEAIDE